MKQQTPPINELINQYRDSREHKRKQEAENNMQPAPDEKTTAPKQESPKEAAMRYLYKPGSDITIIQDLLILQHAYTWMGEAREKPIPDMLFDEFWREGELCMLFADADMGKSVLAMQIADSISRGVATAPFKMQSKKQPVLYVDFELSAKQLEARYSKEYNNHYQFHPNFLRLEMIPNPGDNGRTTFEDRLINSLTQAIEISDAKVLVIDNLTWLSEIIGKASKVKLLMRKLNLLKIKYKLSILLLATAERRKTGKPITRADVQGRSGILNFCDSAFCIGESTKASNLRYIKQLRSRATEMVYTKDNVCVCEIKKEYNFKQFEFLQYSTEQAELMSASEQQELARYYEILDLKKQGRSNVEIASIYEVTEGAIRLWLKRGEEKCATTATSATTGARVPGGVLNPFGAMPGKEDLQADFVNAEGVQNPSGVKNATMATSATTDISIPGGVLNPFGAIPGKEDLEGVFLNAEGVHPPLRLEKCYERYELRIEQN